MSLDVTFTAIPAGDETEMEFIDQPSMFCNWVIYPILMIGDIDSGEPPNKVKLWGIDIWLDLGNLDNNTDRDIADKVHHVFSFLNEGKKVFLYDRTEYRAIKVFLMCLIQSWFRWELNTSLIYVDSCLYPLSVVTLTPFQISQTKRYRRPLTVLICGDRNSSVCFEEMINFELKSLPRYSTIVHGGCRGVDLYAAELAKLSGLETKEYRPEWDRDGRAAGPIRNQKMLDSEKIDLVLAFHPDISVSTGTRNMMTLAWKSGILVYIHDLKRKMKFEGDFDVL